MRFDVISVFPGMFDSVFEASLVRKARDAGLLEIHVHDLRDHTLDKHRRVDDAPFGGGVGMILTIQPIASALEMAKKVNPEAHSVLLTPGGIPMSQKKAWELSRKPGLILVCGRYEGVDGRVGQHLVDEEISIGDYVLSGGEIPAMVMLDALSRLIPGVIGDADAVTEESFDNGLLEYPQYTRPKDYLGLKVPDVLLSGHHANIQEWQHEQAVKKTRRIRPDLLKKFENGDS